MRRPPRSRAKVDPDKAQDVGAIRRAALLLMSRRDFASTELAAKLTAQGYIAVDISSDTLSDPTRLKLTFRSTLPHLGAEIVLRGVRVTSESGAVAESRLVGGPTTIELAPEASSRPITVEVATKLPPGRFFGQETQAQRFAVSVDASVTAEPKNVLQQSVGVTTKARLVQPDRSTARRTVGVAWWVFVVVLILLALLALLLLWLYRRFVRTPPLPGGVQLPSGKFEPFRGKTTRIPGVSVTVPNSDGAVVEFFTKRGKFRGRTPRVYVRKLEGSCRVRSFGVDQLLQNEASVMPTDYVVVGRAPLRVLTKGK